MKQSGREELQAHWDAAAAAGGAVFGTRGTTGSRILEWHRVDAAGMLVGCTGRLTAVVLKRGGRHMAEKEGQSSEERCMARVLHDAEEEEEGGAADADAAVVVADGCSGSS